ncbi:FG-GAP-like repeat-containing protein [Luteimonas sp. RD2P54]|uniref:FG-GAP-like repeat-containing protein n=1 Tax=Luteimonas endophytica TaxID=3042023 RepID=A0ABT6JDN1_9GAMM|nr:FG-GAP-like repeat-containing protein [Luteimonas endophytica]MDH5824924.1 FG-GAP-like repeat-containing protein [Luteimonas endophytica]
MTMMIGPSRRAKAPAFVLVAFVFLVMWQIALRLSQALADPGGGGASTAIVADSDSDEVAATAAEFRVDESGAATYSVPIYAVPGTAGVVPQLSLNYSSQGGYGPLGKGWSIGGLSAISRCRATREAGDFVSGGVPVDGNPVPINYTATDRFCLDGQRLVPGTGGAACPAVSGMSVQTLRTEIESFQRVCAYTPSGGSNGPAFFTVARKDGSTSWYGDRSSDATANRPDGYVQTNAPGHTAKALVWAQTRFQDSTGNYIDYTYLENPGTAAGSSEHLLQEVRYTGKTVLTGQSGSALAPYAKIVFNYTALPSSKWGFGYQAGGSTHTQRYRLTSITSCASAASGCAVANQARYYVLTYATSASGSQMDQLVGLQECRDSSAAVCMAPTTFEWSLGKHEFASVEKPANLATDTSSLLGFKQGDIDGDGRPDFVYLRGSSSGCSTNWIVTGLSRLDASGRPTFEGWSSVCLPADISQRDEGAWHLVDYDGDGRDDLLVAGPSGQNWRLYRSTGTAFSTSQNLIADVPLSPSTLHLADLNGDGLIDIVYVSAGAPRARLMTRQGSGFAWGAERLIQIDAASLGPMLCDGDPYTQNCERFVAVGPTPKTGFAQLADFNGDASSDLLFAVTTTYDEWTFEPECESGKGSFNTKADPCWRHRQARRLHAMTVEVPATGTIIARNYGTVAGDAHAVVLADFNGDGLTDVASRLNASSEWDHRVNTGRGLMSGGSLPVSDYRDQVRFADVNGDGRTDMLHVGAYGSNKVYYVRHAQPNGGFASSVLLPGGNARICEGSGCDPGAMTPLFADLDGDGHVDFMSLRLQNNPTVYVSRSNSRHAPRDAITRITNGLGAQTNILLAPLTNKDLHRRDSGSRANNWGRGSPVMDLLAPIYAVARVSSSSPQAGAPNAMATVHYRYTGAKVQAGGRGFLGFRQIVTYDPNQVGGYVVVGTNYAQNFPFIGMPTSTNKRVVAGQTYAVPACLGGGAITDACFATPGQGFPSVGGSVFSTSTHEWEADGDIGAGVALFAPGVQRPLHVRTLGTEETLRDPFTGATTSKVVTTFDYGAYGNVITTSVDTHTGTASSPMSTVITQNAYSDNAALWRLGRMTSSTVTHRRPSRADVVRTADFAYDTGTGPVTGLLRVERSQRDAGADQDIRKEYTRDAFGNVIQTVTCAAPVSPCTTGGFTFRPANLQTVHRYSRTTFDSRGRYALATYEPFQSAAGSIEIKTQTVVARNIFGDVTQAYDVNGVDTLAVTGSFGRPFYTWVETVPGSTPGDPAGGVESRTHYRWCGGTITCPAGAKFRQQVAAEAAPVQWTYFDALGRPILQATQSFNVGVSDKDASAVCTDYDAAGRPRRVSNPFFLAGTASTAGGVGPSVAANVCTAGRAWNTTTYDALGRPTLVTGADTSTVQTAYAGLATTVTDQRGKATTQTRNGLGELTKVTDAIGTETVYSYYADGSLYYVHRDSGRGQIRNTFYYDAAGRKIRQVDPDSGTTHFEYNALGELIAQQDSVGNRIENEVDGRGRVWRRIVKTADGTIESRSTFNFDTAANGRGQPANETIWGTYLAWQGQTGTALSYSRSYAYDSLGRPVGATTVIDGTNYPATTVYNPLGQVWKSQDASGRWTMTQYNARGHAAAVCPSSETSGNTGCPGSTVSTNPASRTVLHLLETDAWGNPVRERRGQDDALAVNREYWANTGRLARICAGNATTCNLVDEAYGWDMAGNLSTQRKESRYLETFAYDSLNRFSSAKLTMRNGVTVNQTMLAQSYDRLGNPCRRDEDGGNHNYVYDGRAGCGLGDGNSGYGSGNTTGANPHRVAQYRDMHYYYDARGNQTSRDAPGTANDRTVHYSLDDKAHEVRLGNGTRARFWYGPDGQRYKREDQNGRRTLYIGNVEIVTEGAATTIKRNIAGVMLQTIVGSTATNRYLFHDHLGSVVRITDASGAVQNSQDYRAYGSRRSYTDPTAAGTAAAITPRGYTGHEHLDGLDVIHMNGRIYDPTLHRFLQPDPVIQAPGNMQGWNAYTYVFNNPLVYTDPTGMISWRKVLGIVIAVVGTYVTGGLDGGTFAKLGMAMAFGAASGYVATGTWQGALWGAFSAAAFYGVGEAFAGVTGEAGTGVFGSGLSSGAYGAKVIAHGATGGVMSTLQGGKFGHGFASAGVTQVFAPGIDQIGGRAPSYAGARIAAAAALGGTAAKLSGGKFANGAITAAFSRAFNEENHQARAERLRRVNAIRARVDEFREAHPGRVIPLGASDLGVLAEHNMYEVAYYQSVEGEYSKMSRYQFMDLMRGSRGDTSTFSNWMGEVFDISGMPGGYSGLHNGNDINYMMQGMSWAARGESAGAMRQAIRTWNTAQFAAGVAGGDFSTRNIAQIQHANRWANFGHAYYLRGGGDE